MYQLVSLPDHTLPTYHLYSPIHPHLHTAASTNQLEKLEHMPLFLVNLTSLDSLVCPILLLL